MVEAFAEALSACLTDEEVLAFADGGLAPSRLAAAHLHLDECEVCQRLISEAARSLATAVTVPLFGREGVAWNTTFQAGAIVGQRYQIRQFIARGGMGEVYEAFDRDLHERVALKTVTSTACDNPLAVRRLKGEVQLARRVSHPNVCRIYDFGTHVMADTGAQISFLTMEFVDGETLGARLRIGGALNIPEARRLGRQLLMGLSAAHDAGVLHRDFKSDNVMLKDVAGQACPLILDFGLARAFDHDGRRAGSVSNVGLVGTLNYLAPEQLEGKPHSIASDIYSLGMVWFEMLTGELPFEGSPSAAVAALERMQKQAPAPSSRNPEVPSDLDAIVAGCLRRSPKHRFKNTSEALAALDELERRSRPLLGRHKRLLLGACSLAVVGLGSVLGRAPPARHAPIATPNTVSTTAQAPQASARTLQAPPAGSTATQGGAPPNSPKGPHTPRRGPVAPIQTGVVLVKDPTPAPSYSPPAASSGKLPHWEYPFPHVAPPKPDQSSL